jgi:hypothetical protein
LWQHLCHEEYFVATPFDCLGDQFLCQAAAVHLSGVYQCHAQVEAEAQRRDLIRSPLQVVAQIPRALAKDRNRLSGRKPDRTGYRTRRG